MRTWFESLSALERESLKDTAVVVIGGVCVVAGLLLSGAL